MVNRWNQFWFGSVNPYPLTAFRIVFGIFLFCYLSSYADIIEVAFSSQGVYLPFLIADIAPSPLIARIVYGEMMFLIILFTLGYKTRVVTPFILFFYIYHYLLNLAGLNCSYDRAIIILLFILCFARLDAVWSIESLFLNKEKDKGHEILAWPQRSICVFILILYFGMALIKVLNPLWHDGVMLEANLHCEWATFISFWVIGLNFPTIFYAVLCWGVILFQFFMSFGLVLKPLQKYAFWAGCIFHIMVVIFLNIPEFLFLPLTYLLFMDADQIRRKGDMILKIRLFKAVASRC